MANPNTANLQVLHSFQFGNVQQSRYTPPQLPALADQAPTGYVAEPLMLPAAGAVVALPVPPTWSRVTQVVIENMDTAGYCVVQKKGGGAFTGGSANTPASSTLKTLMASVGQSVNLVTGLSIAQGDFIMLNGNAVVWVSSNTNNHQTPWSAGGNAINLTNMATWLNLTSNVTASGVTANWNGTDLVLTANANGLAGNAASVGWSLTASGTTYQGLITPGILDQVLAPNGGVLAQSFAGNGPAGENTTSPASWTLRSCDANGVLANGAATEVYCYLTGY